MNDSASVAGTFDLYFKAAAHQLPKVIFLLALLLVVSIVIHLILKKAQAYIIDKAQQKGKLHRERRKRVVTIISIFNKCIIILVWAVGLVLILGEIGVNIAPILATAGIFGLAISFGAQNLVRDIISGLFIIMENQVRVGDVAIINGTGGLVEAVNLRTMVLRDLQGVVHIFPNGTINTLSNMTKEWSAYVYDIGVAYREDVDRVMDIIRQVGEELRRDDEFGSKILEPVEIFGLDKFADSALVIKGRIKTKTLEQWGVGREFNRRIKKAFDEQGIEIPFPHRTLYFGSKSSPFEIYPGEKNRKKPDGKNGEDK